MLLTLENIQNQQFNQRFRGYDMAEVDAFLDKISESYLFLSTENIRVKEELENLKNERNQSIDEEQSFKNAIMSAQSFADDLKEKAETQATRLKEDAKEKATTILEEAQEEASTLQDQISILAGEKDRIKEELRTFLNTYLSQVDDDSLGQPQNVPPAEVVSMDQLPEFMEEETEEPTEPEAEELELDTTHSADSDSDSDSEKDGDDVAILYEKIDLDDNFVPTETNETELPAAMNMELNSTDIPEFSADDIGEFDVSDDLDGDMLYSLDDPLDNQGPAVVIDPLDDADNDKK